MALVFLILGQLSFILGLGVFLNTLRGRQDNWFNVLGFLPQEFQLPGGVVLLLVGLTVALISGSILWKSKKQQAS
uniref:Uncharacterized protein n=1 Tax=Thermosporothrix sp. COM3 TaxID=2490863 RepID=A0A455SF29_9CHLR|nr:hypothetical protein KTC_18240 [Thermosporothrix sp. COM3]